MLQAAFLSLQILKAILQFTLDDVSHGFYFRKGKMNFPGKALIERTE